MSRIIFSLLILLPNLVFARACPKLTLSYIADQERMAFKTALDYFEVSFRDVIAIKINRYDAWKSKHPVDPQTGFINCVADVFHYAEFSYDYYSPEGKRCSVDYNLHTRDIFTQGVNNHVSFRVRDVSATDCRAETPEEMKLTKTCREQSKFCRNGTFPNPKSNCQCTSPRDFIEVVNKKAQYNGFFDTDKIFSKPADIVSAFED